MMLFDIIEYKGDYRTSLSEQGNEEHLIDLSRTWPSSLFVGTACGGIDLRVYYRAGKMLTSSPYQDVERDAERAREEQARAREAAKIRHYWRDARHEIRGDFLHQSDPALWNVLRAILRSADTDSIVTISHTEDRVRALNSIAWESASLPCDEALLRRLELDPSRHVVYRGRAPKDWVIVLDRAV